MDAFGIVVQNHISFGDTTFINFGFLFFFKEKIIIPLSKYRFLKQLQFHEAKINLYQIDIQKQTDFFISI